MVSTGDRSTQCSLINSFEDDVRTDVSSEYLPSDGTERNPSIPTKSLAKNMWPLLLINFLYMVLVWVNIGCTGNSLDMLKKRATAICFYTFTGSFLRTAIYCQSPIPPEPNSSIDWSGSAHCSDRTYVLNLVWPCKLMPVWLIYLYNMNDS